MNPEDREAMDDDATHRRLSTIATASSGGKRRTAISMMSLILIATGLPFGPATSHATRRRGKRLCGQRRQGRERKQQGKASSHGTAGKA
jgi:hypothetical protein